MANNWTIFKKKKKTFQAKKKLGLNLKKKLSNLKKKKKKKDFLGQKETNRDWAWKEKKEFLGPKIGEKLSVRVKNWTI